MISTFQRYRHFRKVSVNKTFAHVQKQNKKMMSSRQTAYTPSSVKSPLPLIINENHVINETKNIAEFYILTLLLSKPKSLILLVNVSVT